MQAQRSYSSNILSAMAWLLGVVMLLGAVGPAGAQADPVGDVEPDGQGFPVAGPVILTTDAMLDRARDRVERAEEPFITAWERTKSAADGALDREPEPYHGADYLRYYRTGRGQGHDVRHLAVAHAVTGEQAYADKAREYLAAWAADGIGSHPGSDSPHSSGLVIGRVITMWADAYSIVYDEMSQDEREAVHDWFQAMVGPILESQRIWEKGSLPGHEPPWLNRQFFNNHLGAQTMGLTAIGYATDDRQLIRYAINHPDNPRHLETLIDGAILMAGDDLWHGDPTLTEGDSEPEPGEIYDRYRMIGNTGLHYAHIHLRFLTLMAEMVHNNNQDRDRYGYVGPNGENLEVSYEFYAEFVATDDTGARTGYYTDAARVDTHWLPMYELAHRHYPDNAEIRNALESRPRVVNDIETFGWTAVLTHGGDGLAEAPPYPSLGITSWAFETDGDLEGWQVRKTDAEVSDGGLHLFVDAADPGIVSPNELGIDADDYPYVRIRMRNGTGDTVAQFFFVTDDDTTYGRSKSLGFSVSAQDDDYVEYVLDMGANEQWAGRIKQIRFDPVHGNSSGTVSIDVIEFAEAP